MGYRFFRVTTAKVPLSPQLDTLHAQGYAGRVVTYVEKGRRYYYGYFSGARWRAGEVLSLHVPA